MCVSDIYIQCVCVCVSFNQTWRRQRMMDISYVAKLNQAYTKLN